MYSLLICDSVYKIEYPPIALNWNKTITKFKLDILGDLRQRFDFFFFPQWKHYSILSSVLTNCTTTKAFKIPKGQEMQQNHNHMFPLNSTFAQNAQNFDSNGTMWWNSATFLICDQMKHKLGLNGEKLRLSCDTYFGVCPT